MNKSLPPETIIKLSRTRILWLIAAPLIVAGSVYLLIKGGPFLQYVMAAFGCVVGLLLTVMNYADLGELNKPQLIISNQGIRHRNGEQFSWKNIKDEKVVYQGTFHPLPYLSFQTAAGNRLFNMRHWSKRPETVLLLMQHYRTGTIKDTNHNAFKKIPKPVLYTLLVLYLAGMAIILRKAYLGYRQQGADIVDAQDFPYSRYSISNGKIYYLKAGSGYFPVDSADARTFQALNTVNDRGTMGKDARHIFFKTAPVPDLKPRDLLVYLGTNFCKTKIGVFYGRYLVKAADTASFHYIADYYAADNRHLYYKQNIVPGADARSLQAISFDSAKGNPPDEYIKDKNHVYFKGLRIDGARPAEFTFLPAEDDVWDTKYAFDGHHYFNDEHEILVDHDEHKTQLRLLTLDKGFGWHGLFYQDTAIYCYDTDRHELVLMGHRDKSAPFTPINRGIFTDGKHVYFTFSIWNRSGGRMPRFVGHTTGLCVVEGANPRNFKATGNFVTADHVEGLLYQSGPHTYFHPNTKPLGNYSAGLMLLKADGTTEQLPSDKKVSKFIRDKDDGTSIFSLQFYKNLLKPDSVYDDY